MYWIIDKPKTYMLELKKKAFCQLKKGYTAKKSNLRYKLDLKFYNLTKTLQKLLCIGSIDTQS